MAEDDLDHHAPPSSIATLIDVLPEFNNKVSEMTQYKLREKEKMYIEKKTEERYYKYLIEREDKKIENRYVRGKKIEE